MVKGKLMMLLLLHFSDIILLLHIMPLSNILYTCIFKFSFSLNMLFD